MLHFLEERGDIIVWFANKPIETKQGVKKNWLFICSVRMGICLITETLVELLVN
jgi:hypothetical protein